METTPGLSRVLKDWWLEEKRGMDILSGGNSMCREDQQQERKCFCEEELTEEKRGLVAGAGNPDRRGVMGVTVPNQSCAEAAQEARGG